MKEWFNALEQREQRLVSTMGIFVIIAGLYFLLIQPFNERMDKAETKLANEQRLLTWVEKNASTIIKLRGQSGKGATKTGSLDQQVNRSARKHNIVINRLQPQNKKLQIMIDKASFTQVLQWVQSMQLDYGLTVEIADFRKDKQSGFVKTRIVVGQ